MSNPLNPLERLDEIRKDSTAIINDKQKNAKTKIYIGIATCEIAAGASDILKIIEDAKLKDVFIGKKGCRGACYQEPTLEIVEEGKDSVLYVNVTENKAKEIIERHFK